MNRARVAIVAGAIVAMGAALVVGAFLLRPTSTATTASGVTVECAGVADDSACAAWAATVLADGPGMHTFDPDDLEHVRLGRSVFGLIGDCRAEYFVGRFGGEPVARETVACPSD